MNNSKKIKQFFAALAAKGIKEEGRKAIIYSFTNERTASLKEAREEEVDAMIAHLNELGKDQPKPPARPKLESAEDVQKDRMRKAVIRYFCLMGYTTKAGRPDMNRIQAWAVKYGAAHKRLNDLRYLDLVDLVTQAETVYRKFLKGIKPMD